MIELNIPGKGTTKLEHLVLDVNGTIATDGRIIESIPRQVHAIKDRLQIHILTANTFGKQGEIDRVLDTQAEILARDRPEAAQKAEIVRVLGADSVVAIGNGRNDASMLAVAAIGVAVLGEEGLAVEALTAADVVVRDIYDALALLENPVRLVATLRG